MTFFEKELSKYMKQFDQKKFIGNAMYLPMGAKNRLKVEFVTLGTQEQYEGVRLTALDKTSGTIDSTTIKFREIWGKYQIPNNPNFKDGIVPHIWRCQGNYKWYQEPTENDVEKLAEQIEDYTILFGEEEQVEGFTMTQQM